MTVEVLSVDSRPEKAWTISANAETRVPPKRLAHDFGPTGQVPNR